MQNLLKITELVLPSLVLPSLVIFPEKRLARPRRRGEPKGGPAVISPAVISHYSLVISPAVISHYSLVIIHYSLVIIH